MSQSKEFREEAVTSFEELQARNREIERSVEAGERTAEEGKALIEAMDRADVEAWLKWGRNPDDPYLVRWLKDGGLDKECLYWLQKDTVHLIFWDTPHGVLECFVAPKNYNYPVVHLIRPSVAKVLAHGRRLVAEEGWTLVRGDLEDPEE
jgi:hypothetical protein